MARPFASACVIPNAVKGSTNQTRSPKNTKTIKAVGDCRTVGVADYIISPVTSDGICDDDDAHSRPPDATENDYIEPSEQYPT